MKNLLIKILPMTIGLVFNQVQGYKSSHPRVWYTKVKNREAPLARENEIKFKENERTKNLIEECKKKSNKIVN